MSSDSPLSPKHWANFQLWSSLVFMIMLVCVYKQWVVWSRKERKKKKRSERETHKKTDERSLYKIYWNSGPSMGGCKKSEPKCTGSHNDPLTMSHIQYQSVLLAMTIIHCCLMGKWLECETIRFSQTLCHHCLPWRFTLRPQSHVFLFFTVCSCSSLFLLSHTNAFNTLKRETL
jgi:hypothetical protein